MRKLLLGIVCSFIMGTNVIPMNTSLIESKLIADPEAIQVMEEFISTSQLGNEAWEGHEISGVEELFDGNLDIYGYLFELESLVEEGYGIVLNSGTSYVVVEASPDTKSPYSDYDDNYLKVYTTALNYFVYEKNTRSGELYDLVEKKSVNSNELTVARMDLSQMESSRNSNSARTTTSRLLSNIGLFRFITQQPNTEACIPTSFAMALRYWHNIGKITLTFSGSNAQMKDSLFDEMGIVGAEPAVTDVSARDGIRSWTIANCSDYYVTIRIDNFFPTVSEFNEVKGEINNNNPSVIMFYPAVFGRTHATTMVGYQIIDGTNYVTVCDPYQETYNTRTIIWNTSNVYGFFLLERRSMLTL